jgi:hypothetical protein
VSDLNLRRSALTIVVVGLFAAGCGGSGATTAPIATPPAATIPAASVPASAPPSAGTATSAAATCPTAAIVGAALGVTLSPPTGVAGGGGVQLPAGATGIACEYHAAAANVLIELITGVNPSIISKFSSRFPVPYTGVVGVGDQARSFRQSLNGGRDNEGVVATKGSSLVAITATATPATLSQVETLVSQLL